MANSGMKLTQEGYNDYLKLIEKYENQLKEINAKRNEAFNGGAGDGWDDPAFEEIERESKMIEGEIAILKQQLASSETIESHDNSSLVNIGDIVTIAFDGDDSEKEVFKLVGGIPNFTSSTPEISLNSPLGKAIYQKSVGDTCFYEVNNAQFSIKIIDKQ